MNKVLLTLGLATLGVSNAFAYWLATPVITSQKIEDGKVTIEWSYDSSVEQCNDFQVIVYKKHRAQKDENYVLAKTDFGYLESTGTMEKHEERGAIWDYVVDCPGWWVKRPLYMQNAMGIEAFSYFAGSDNDDIFGGAYMVSPDYDLTDLSDPTLTVTAQLANEASSVSGGFCIWAWNTNWWDPNNIDYKPLTPYNLDFHYDLSSYNWKDVSEFCVFPESVDYEDPEELEEVNGICMSRARVMFYGVGYSTYWVNGFNVSVDMKKGETVDYGASQHFTKENTFTIDTSGDTEDDWVYAYEVRAIYWDYDDYRDVTTVRAINYPYTHPKYIISETSGIENTVIPEKNFKIRASKGSIAIEGAEGEKVNVYSTSGACIFEGTGDNVISAESGIYIVRVGKHSEKVVI